MPPIIFTRPSEHLGSLRLLMTDNVNRFIKDNVSTKPILFDKLWYFEFF